MQPRRRPARRRPRPPIRGPCRARPLAPVPWRSSPAKRPRVHRFTARVRELGRHPLSRRPRRRACPDRYPNGPTTPARKTKAAGTACPGARVVRRRRAATTLASAASKPTTRCCLDAPRPARRARPRSATWRDVALSAANASPRARIASALSRLSERRASRFRAACGAPDAIEFTARTEPTRSTEDMGRSRPGCR